MPGKSTKIPVAADGTAVISEKTVDAERAETGKKKFKVEKLRANSMKLFKVTASTFDGAMYGHNETEMTIEEARAVINKWLGRKE